jgi:hypothetical protein
MCTSVKLVLVPLLSSIYIFGPFACAFAINPIHNSNTNHPLANMAPDPDNNRLQSTSFGTFDHHPLLPHNQFRGHINRYQNHRLSSLAMIPEHQTNYDNDRNNTQSSRLPTFLDATKRTREARAETKELLPKTPKEDTSMPQLSTVFQPITKTITSLGDTLSTSKKLQGRAILLLVAFLYGTLNVTLRGVYATEGPPVASVLSLVRQILSVVAFIPLLVFSKGTDEDATSSKDVEFDNGSANDQVEKIRPMWMAALELAFWNFGAQVGLLVCISLMHLMFFTYLFHLSFIGSHQRRVALQPSCKSCIPNTDQRRNDPLDITSGRRKHQKHCMGRLCSGIGGIVSNIHCGCRWSRRGRWCRHAHVIQPGRCNDITGGIVLVNLYFQDIHNCKFLP